MTEADDIVALMATILAAETGRAVVLATAEADGDSIAVAVAEAEASRLHVLHVVLALLGGAGRRPPPAPARSVRTCWAGSPPPSPRPATTPPVQPTCCTEPTRPHAGGPLREGRPFVCRHHCPAA